MDEKQNQSDNLKVYIRALKQILENGKNISFTEYKNLIEEYQLTDAEIDRLEELAKSQCSDAESHFESGNWDLCLKTVEEASIKSPFNKNILQLHIKTLDECIRFSEENTYYLEQKILVLQRLKEVDKKGYKLLSRKPFKTPHILIWLIPILIISTTLFILIYSPKERSLDIVQPFNPPVTKGIIIEHNFNTDTFNPNITIVENDMKKFSGTFQYSLKILLSSESYNISKIEGDLKLYDRDNHLLVSTPFSSNKGHRYFKNEEIPIVVILNSLREGPDIRKAVFDYTTIEKSKSQDRENMKPLNLIDNTLNRVEILEYNYNIITGINKTYMEWELIIENNSTLPLKELKGEIEWYDENKIVISSYSFNLLDKNSIRIDKNAKRFVYRVIELPDTITDNYRLRITQ